jgi:hypothetical protein
MMSLDRITHGAMMFLRKERFERDIGTKNPLILP